MGDYKLAFLILLGLYAVALPAVLFVRQPKQFVEKQPAVQAIAVSAEK